SVTSQTPGDGTPGNPAYIELQLATSCSPLAVSGTPVKFPFTGADGWSGSVATVTCNGFQSLVPLAPCTQNLQVDNITIPHLQPEIQVLSNGTLNGYAETANGDIDTAAPGAGQPTPFGIKAAGSTPIANSLSDIKTIWNNLWATTISTQTPRPRT